MIEVSSHKTPVKSGVGCRHRRQTARGWDAGVPEANRNLMVLLREGKYPSVTFVIKLVNYSV